MLNFLFRFFGINKAKAETKYIIPFFFDKAGCVYKSKSFESLQKIADVRKIYYFYNISDSKVYSFYKGKVSFVNNPRIVVKAELLIKNAEKGKKTGKVSRSKSGRS